MAPRCSALVTFGLALSMGAVMAPATDSVMGAVPEAKAGVGSAMNDVTRQVGGALGVAVIGSLIGGGDSGETRPARRASRSEPPRRGRTSSAARPGSSPRRRAARSRTRSARV